MIRRPPRSTRMTHPFPTRRSSDLREVVEPGEQRIGQEVDAAEALEGDQEDQRDNAEAEGDGNSGGENGDGDRSEEHTSELQSLMRISYAVFCLKKKNKIIRTSYHSTTHVK